MTVTDTSDPVYDILCREAVPVPAVPAVSTTLVYARPGPYHVLTIPGTTHVCTVEYINNSNTVTHGISYNIVIHTYFN